MLTIKEAVELTNNIVNPSDAEQLKNYIYELQKENIDFKSQLIECKSKLQVFQEWANTKSLYQEFKTEHGSIVYRKIKETIPDVLYCPVCFDNKSIKPIQPIPSDIARSRHIMNFITQWCPSCDILYTI